MDVTDAERARERFDALVEAMGGVDLVVLSAGTERPNRDLDRTVERETVAVNARGFAALAAAAMTHFDERGSGTLVGISRWRRCSAAERRRRTTPRRRSSRTTATGCERGRAAATPTSPSWT